jgi:peptidoglycan hydrolase-like protein with peptidoglycan-binding domain
MQNKIMNFNQFSKVYESTMNLPEDETAFNYGEEISEEEAAAAPPKDDAETAVVSSDGSIEVPPSEILALLKDLGKKEGDKAEEAPAEETPNESLDEQDSTNTLKPAKMGEKSERVKDIQKLLGLTVDGDFGQATKDAVMKFQKAAKVKDPDILVDGVVGNQTYGLMLRVKKGITDKSQIQAMVDKFQGAGKTVVAAAKAGKNIALDPKLYDLFEKIEIITINGTTYVVATPKSDASAKIDSLKKAKLIGADFSWLLAIPAAVGKAIIYTAVGGTIVTLEVAKAMVNTALSAGAYIGKASAAVVSNIVYGVGQISNWVVAKGAQGWAALKQDTAAALAAWKGYNEKGKAILKSSKDAAVAWATAAAASLSKEIGAAYREATRVMLVGIAGTLGIAWAGAKSLGDLVKTGMSQMAAGGKGLANKIQAAYDDAVKRANAVGNAVNAEFQKAGAEVTNVLKSGVTAAGDALISAGGWLKGLAESLDNNGGELVLEWLEY